ncbi:MAG TPA: hypothetical protein VMZ66_11550, partial [Aeromicrobium sp.]|nr:hypothetical protein [Aeromicrobium sp.]
MFAIVSIVDILSGAAPLIVDVRQTGSGSVGALKLADPATAARRSRKITWSHRRFISALHRGVGPIIPKPSPSL